MSLPAPINKTVKAADEVAEKKIVSPVGYLATEEGVSAGINGRIGKVFLRSLGNLFKSNKNIYDLFFSLTKKLNKFFSLSRSILVIHSNRDDCLKVIAIKGVRGSRVGLALTLPREGSLLYRVLDDGVTYTENYPDKFNGNFIEKKLLLDDDPGSIVVYPVLYNDAIQGLICLTSPALYAFTLFNEGVLDPVLDKFGKSIEREAKRLRV